MCNRFRAAIVKAGKQFEEWGYEEFSETRIRIFDNQVRQEMYPDYSGLVARLDDAGKLVPDVMRWGFPPPSGVRQVVTNVRNTASPFWQRWLSPKSRCLIPATAFAEPAGKGQGNYWFAPQTEDTFCFAGIWTTWTGTRGTKKDPAEGEHKLFAFLTTSPSEFMKPYHDAMPVILDRNDWQTWLTAPKEEALKLQRPADEYLLKILDDRSR